MNNVFNFFLKLEPFPGHSSIQITLDTYSHVAPGLQEAAALRFDDVLIKKVQIDNANIMH
jgi:hypothetical protein